MSPRHISTAARYRGRMISVAQSIGKGPRWVWLWIPRGLVASEGERRKRLSLLKTRYVKDRNDSPSASTT